MVTDGNHGERMFIDDRRLCLFRSKEAYSVARQFNLIPPTGEQSEYNFFQREKVEVLLPDVFHKIGQLSFQDERERETFLRSSRHWHDDVVTISMWNPHRQVRRWRSIAFQSSTQSNRKLTVRCSEPVFTLSQSYRWLKEKVLSDEGRKQQSKLRELTSLASTFDCTLAQLAIGQSSFADRSPRIFSFSLVFEKRQCSLCSVGCLVC